MSRRYELTDQEWEQIALLLPPENTRKTRTSFERQSFDA